MCMIVRTIELAKCLNDVFRDSDTLQVKVNLAEFEKVKSKFQMMALWEEKC
ncbi:hypothetical protein ACT7C1_32665 [Bacillus paranthracis]